MTVTSEGGQVTDALKGKLTFEQSKDRIIGRDENNLARLLILANGVDFVMKVSQDGTDVLTGSNDDMVFNSNNNLFKIVGSGTHTTATYSVSGGSSGVWTSYLGSPATIAHNLGYVPSVLAYVNNSGQYVLLPTTFQQIVGNLGSGAAFNRVAVNMDSTNIYILDTTLVNGVVTTPYTAGGLSIKYFLLQETAN